MALLLKKGICDCPYIPLLQFKRFRGKINIQKPRPAHFEKAKFLALTKPIIQIRSKKVLQLCTKTEPSHKTQTEENIYQDLLAKELRQRFENSKLIAFCHLNPMLKDQTFNAFVAFYKEKMHFERYGKETVRLAVIGTPFETVIKLFMSQTTMIFSPEPQLKTLLRILRKFPELVLMAGIYENRFLSKDELVKYSKVPNIQAAQSELVYSLNGVGAQVVRNLNSHQTTLMSHLEQRVAQLEGGEG
ncbi:large ribosomal subunit protein uL10m-like [Euwallacea fornicatus]|uniref:large ribosomal subunit protein uL10m-like n=1 Tax=Euwallacea fornicatus TaxID=995702 RepID=UPI00338F1174